MKNMLYIVWQESGNLGIPIIDEQHRAIVTMINSLYYFIHEGRGLEALRPTLETLEQYTRIHFITEEELMRRAGFEGIDEHVALHGELAGKMKTIARESLQNREPEQALEFLKRWWLDHINGEDRLYVPAVMKILST